MSIADEAARDLVNGAEEELNQLLTKLTIDGQEAKALARGLVEISVQVTTARLLGEDTAIAEKALSAAAKNLATATTITAARRVSSFADELIVRVGIVASRVIAAALI